MHAAARAGHRAGTLGFHRTGHQRGAGFGLHRYRACLFAVDAQAAAGVEAYVPRGTQHDLAAGVAHDLVRVDDSGIAQRSAVNADLAALRQNPAQVHGGVIARRKLDTNPRRTGIENLHRVAGSQDYVALRAGDDAAVADIGADQIDTAACRRGDTALVLHLAGQRIGGEIEAVGEKVLVAQIER